MARDYLTELLEAYWFAPAVALWRAIELRVADKMHYEPPLLDLGCGDGLIGQVLFGQQGQVDVGVDPWMDQLRQAAQLGVYGHVDQGTGCALPYAHGYFSTVFSNSVLEHIADVAPVIREVARVLKPEGRFIFTVPSDAFRWLLDGHARQMAAGNPHAAEAYANSIDLHLEHYHYHGPNEWKKILCDTGMTVVQAEYYLPEQVERLWDRVNRRYDHSRAGSAWKALVSPRLRRLGYQRILRRLVVRYYSQRWRPYYEMDVQQGRKGGGLLVVAKRKE